MGKAARQTYLVNFMYLFFNERSLPVPDEERLFLPILKDFKNSIDLLKNEYGIDTVRVKEHFKDYSYFSTSMQLSHFINTLSANTRTLLKTLIANRIIKFSPPLTLEDEESIRVKIHYENELIVEDQCNTGGVACAYFFDGITLSFSTETSWKKDKINANLVYFKQGCIKETEVEIANISCENHIQNLSQRITLLSDITESEDSLIKHFSKVTGGANLKFEFTENFKKEAYKLNQIENALLCKLSKLLISVGQDPQEGIGKPEPLKENLAGFWSRRISDEHRLVYKMEPGKVVFDKCFGHY